jgi:hypothetical protein
MESSQERRVLIVASRTVATPTLLEEVGRLARERLSTFALLIPESPSERTDVTLELARPLFEKAAGGPVEGLTGGDDAFEAISAAVADRRPDLVVISTLPTREVSTWLREDLAHRVEALGVAVQVVTYAGEGAGQDAVVTRT